MMWNNLLKLSVLSYIWKRYRKTIILLPLLLLYFWVVGLIHDDYLAYAELQGANQSVGASFVVKWLMLFVGAMAFIAAHLYSRKNAALPKSSSLKAMKKADKEHLKNSMASVIANSPDSKADGFERLREKSKLRSKADVILSKRDG